MFSKLSALIFCCWGHRVYDAPLYVRDATIIPKETSNVVHSQPSSPVIMVDHRKLADKLSEIVRAKKGKMVNLGARAPFRFQSSFSPPSASAESIAPTSAESITSRKAAVDVDSVPQRALLGRLPVLTITRASSQGSLRYQESLLSVSSTSASRSSSHFRPDGHSEIGGHVQSFPNSPLGLGYRKYGNEFQSSGLDVESRDEPVPTALTHPGSSSQMQAVTFSWDEPWIVSRQS
ncbi:hypothetical protein MVEN_01827300 [Mycena venus]|uniref:Uncharacterized protein n=1 Tax=Mycena venus TaxID=2733690 RepID=A0A8H7CLR9_9AGAR|nr:hypothetical protein MVEN_01827300 [Mycena venus]